MDLGTAKSFGRYEIGSKIGQGGMGEVFSAVDPQLGRNIAIKLLPSEFTSDADRQARFRQEARVVSALNHPNIITIYEIGENEHGSFLATEYIDGNTLRDVARSESLTIPKILRLIEQAAHALVAAHAAKIVHRDIKPENIMVRRDGIVKVLDFGLAKPNDESAVSDSSSNLTIPGTVMGSARYMSPEQARGREVDERTDIWSLGVVMYELLVGFAPFDGETNAETMANVIHKEPTPIGQVLPGAPIELQRILRKALQKDRDERYQSVKDFALDIKDLLSDLEHADSGERKAHTTSSPQFSENPTIIHTTADPACETGEARAASGVMRTVHPAKRTRSPVFVALAGGSLLVILVIGALAWYGRGRTLMAASAFDRAQISRINTDGKIQLPAISPDGKYVAYVSGDAGNRSIVVRQISTDSQVTIVPATNLNFSALSFSPNGDYVYYCETRSDFSLNTLYQVPTLGGTPRKLIEDVDSTVSFSPDGKQFVFVRHVSNNKEDVVFIADTATLQTRELTSSRKAGFDFFSMRPAWSPKGQMILLGTGKRQSGSVSEMSIAAASVDDGSVKLLNTGRFLSVGNFVWFADGSGFIFAGRETQSAPVQIWRAGYPDVQIHQVTNDFNDYGEVGLSADGSTIVTIKGEAASSIWKYSSSTKDLDQLTADGRNPEGMGGLVRTPSRQIVFTRREGKETKIWIADANGKNPRMVGPVDGSGFSPTVTPDGLRIIFNLQKYRTSRIWSIGIDGTNDGPLVDEGPESADYNPQLTADGKTVIFQRQFTNEDRSALMKVPAAGGPVSVFYSDKEHGAWGPRVSPDGTRIAFTVYDVATFIKRVVVAKLNGDNLGEIEREFDYNLINQIAWAPDSKSLTFLTSRAGLPNVWSQPLDGSAPKPLTDFKSGQIFNFAWSGDKELLLARGSVNSDLILIRDSGRVGRASDVAGISASIPAS